MNDMRKLTHKEISEKRITVERIDSAVKMPVVALLNSIRSNYNVGSIFRTSDGAMIEKLYLCGYTPYPPKKEILKTALGATESVDWEFAEDPVNVIKDLKERGFRICALEQTTESRSYYELSSEDFPLCLIIGNEITGVNKELIDLCDLSIDIPQHGIKQSLNVAVAYGIAVFELRKIFDTR